MPQRRERVFIEGYLGGGSAGKVLSVRRNCSQNFGKVSNTYYGTRQGRVHKPDELMNSLACSGHNGGGVKSSLSLPVDQERERKREN